MSYSYIPNSVDESQQLETKTPWLLHFLGEISVFFGFIFLLLAAFSLLSYSPQDSAWSTSGAGNLELTHNWLGVAGAIFSDILYFCLGMAAWALFGFLCLRWLAAIRKLKATKTTPSPAATSPEHNQHPPAAWSVLLGRYLGLTVLLTSSCALLWSRAYNLDTSFPIGAGGALGHWLGGILQTLLGFNGLAIVLLPIWVLSLSWTYGFSWDRVILALGTFAERLFYGARFWRERVKDQRFSKQAVQERADWQTQVAQAPATVIAPAPPVVMPSTRVEKDRQGHLFAETESAKLPPLILLDTAKQAKQVVSPETLEMTSRLIEKKLSDFGVNVQVLLASPGPVVTRYEIEPAAGVKGAQIVNLARDLARALSIASIRVIETIPGKACMALELPNTQRQSIGLSEILGSQVYEASKSLLSLALGKDIVGNPVVVDLAKMPHCLVAGTTGSGKSVGINAMLLSLLFKAEAKDVRLLLIDPKMLELSVYEGIPHLLAPVVTDMRQAANGLNWCVAEMERRYKLMSSFGVRNIAGFNQKLAAAQARGEILGNPFSLTPESPEPLEHLPFIVVVIDELADLMMVVGKKIEESIARLAQKARASGIHLVLATQRPSVDVITGLIKANIPTRISFQVSSKIDSRTILDQMGAEALLGMGDMLYMSSGSGLPIRVHGAFVSDDEVHRVVEYLHAQGEANYIEGILEGKVDGSSNDSENSVFAGYGNDEQDPLYDQAVQVVLKNRKASISLVQRHLKIGYNRSARLLEAMETAGMVSSLSSNGQREILVPNNNEAQQ